MKTLIDLYRHAKQHGYVLNPSVYMLQMLLTKENADFKAHQYYYCPCKMEKIPENSCPCQNSDIEIQQDGYCHCRMYYNTVPFEISILGGQLHQVQKITLPEKKYFIFYYLTMPIRDYGNDIVKHLLIIDSENPHNKKLLTHESDRFMMDNKVYTTFDIKLHQKTPVKEKRINPYLDECRKAISDFITKDFDLTAKLQKKCTTINVNQLQW